MVRTNLWQHQRDAVAYVLGSPRRAAMLGMPMATGKSLTTLAIADEMGARCVFIGCPSAVVLGWSNQLLEHAEDPSEWVAVFASKKLRVVVGGVRVHLKNNPSGRDRADAVRRYWSQAQREGKRFLFVTNHEAVFRDPLSDVIRGLPIDLLVADEVHKLKAPKGRASKWYWNLRAKKRREVPGMRVVGLTGTILPHSPLDAFAQYRFLDDGLFGRSFFRFRNRYALMGGFENRQVIGYVNQDELHGRMAEITFQVDKSVVDLPDERPFQTRVQLGDAGRKVYGALEDNLCAELSVDDEVVGTVSIDNPLGKLLRLQQVCSGYVPLDPLDPFDVPELRRVDHAKEEALDARLEVTPETEPLVVFARFRPDLDTIAEVCARHDRPCLELSGRVDQLEEWHRACDEGGAPLLAVQIQAGGVGVELQRASFACYYSVGFSLGDYLQSRARLARPGAASGHVQYEHLVAEDTVDVSTYRCLEMRRELVEGVLADVRARAEALAGRR